MVLWKNLFTNAPDADLAAGARLRDGPVRARLGEGAAAEAAERLDRLGAGGSADPAPDGVARRDLDHQAERRRLPSRPRRQALPGGRRRRLDADAERPDRDPGSTQAGEPERLLRPLDPRTRRPLERLPGVPRRPGHGGDPRRRRGQPTRPRDLARLHSRQSRARRLARAPARARHARRDRRAEHLQRLSADERARRRRRRAPLRQVRAEVESPRATASRGRSRSGRPDRSSSRVGRLRCARARTTRS